jgi:hypothetical protein
LGPSDLLFLLDLFRPSGLWGQSFLWDQSFLSYRFRLLDP